MPGVTRAAPPAASAAAPPAAWRVVVGRVGEAQALARALGPLARAGIPAVVLKGALHRHWGLGARPSRDVDLLVHPERFRDARFALEDEGFGAVAQGSAGVMFGHRGLDREVDVHHRPFPLGMFLMDAEGVFLRAAPARFEGVQALTPSPLDAWALVLGHFVKDRRGPADAARLDVLGALAGRFALAPEAIAGHLVTTGLTAAARAVLPLAAARGDDVVAAILARLPRARTDAAAGALYRVLVRRGSMGPAALLAPHAVNLRGGRALGSALVHGAEGVARRTGHAALWSHLAG